MTDEELLEAAAEAIADMRDRYTEGPSSEDMARAALEVFHREQGARSLSSGIEDWNDAWQDFENAQGELGRVITPEIAFGTAWEKALALRPRLQGARDEALREAAERVLDCVAHPLSTKSDTTPICAKCIAAVRDALAAAPATKENTDAR